MSQITTISNSQPNSPFDAIRGYRADGSEYWTARELMRWLGFSKWQKFEKVVLDAMADIELLDTGSAIQHITQTGKSPQNGGRDLIDYDLSRLGCYHVALACKQRTIEVAAARRYFAAQTRKSEIAQQVSVAELSRLEILQLALASEQEKLALQAQIEADRPATELGKAIEKAESNIRVGDFAKVIGTGQNRYFDELRECKIIMATGTLPYQRFLNDGYFVVTEVVINNKVYPVTLITPKGQAYLAKRHQQYLQAVSIECQIETAFVSALV